MTQSNHLPPPPPASAVAAVPPGFYRASDGNVYPVQAQAPAAPPPPPPQPVAAALPPPPPAQPNPFPGATFVQAPHAPQGFVAVPAAVPQGFAPSAFPQSNLNGLAVGGDALFPQVQGVYDLQLVSFAKRQGHKSGFAYWIGVKVLSSTAPEVPAGATFSFLCPVAIASTKTGGDKRRKAVLAACYAQDPNAAIDWNALSDQTEGMKLDVQPMFANLRMVTDFSRPMLDPNTRQPTGKYWCRETWLRAATAAPQA